MPEKLLSRIGDFLQGRRAWYELPKLLSMPRLVEIRNQLRSENPHDTEEPPLGSQEIPANLDPALRGGRAIDGTYNDLEYPSMGSCGRRFGRNFALQHTFPDTPNLLAPSPRLVSRELMTRDTFLEVPFLNLLAAPCIQSLGHDWLRSKR